MSYMTSPLFEIDGLVKHYAGRPVVQDLSFAIAPGECVGLLGPNGAGKTTTLRMALGLVVPDAGRVRILGLDMPAHARVVKARLGVVAQFDTLDPDFTCAENLLVYGRYFGLTARELRPRIAELLDFAALAHKADARPGELSGGMRRRLSLARALVNDPALLLLDEPTTGLDPQARHLMWERLQRLLQQGKSILLTTHFMDEAERLCHRLVIVDHGRKIAEGRPRELIARHLEPEVIEIYGEQGHADALRELTPEARALAARVEVSGETAFLYTHDARPLLAALGAQPRLRLLHRPANLEDLFLKLTGRQIRAEG